MSQRRPPELNSRGLAAPISSFTRGLSNADVSRQPDTTNDDHEHSRFLKSHIIVKNELLICVLLGIIPHTVYRKSCRVRADRILVDELFTSSTSYSNFQMPAQFFELCRPFNKLLSFRRCPGIGFDDRVGTDRL